MIMDDDENDCRFTNFFFNVTIDDIELYPSKSHIKLNFGEIWIMLKKRNAQLKRENAL
jgi:hypothetical protein